jgi:hypothetical protein
MSTYSLLLTRHWFVLRLISTQYVHFNDMNSIQYVFLWLIHWSHDYFAILFSTRILFAVDAWAAFSINFFEAKIFVMRFESCTDFNVAADASLFNDWHLLIRVNWLILRSYHFRSMLDFIWWKQDEMIIIETRLLKWDYCDEIIEMRLLRWDYWNE